MATRDLPSIPVSELSADDCLLLVSALDLYIASQKRKVTAAGVDVDLADIFNRKIDAAQAIRARLRS